MGIYYILLIVIILQFAYIVYQDYVNRQERERLHLKIMSRDVFEYKEASKTEPDEDMDEGDSDVIEDLSDIDIDTFLKAKDTT